MTDNKMQLLISDARGIYIPRDFAQNFDISKWGLTPEDVEALNSPDNEWYWDQWDFVLTKARYTDANGQRWSLHQDGDLWAIRDLNSPEDELYWYQWDFVGSR